VSCAAALTLVGMAPRLGATHHRARTRRGFTVAAAAVAAFVIAAPSAFANEEVRFDFDPANPNAEHEWTVPTGVTEIEVEAAGAGGGGVQVLTPAATARSSRQLSTWPKA
jgi:hypothetical protein